MSTTKVTDAMRNVTTVDGTKISGAVPSAALTNVDLSKLEYNQAILAFKVASANQLAKFSMVDQVIDEYQDATGIDAGASTNEETLGVTTAKYFRGSTSGTLTPTVTGGTITTDGSYKVHTFTSSGTFTTDTTQDMEYLVIAGGGGGGGGSGSNGAGGGAGGYRTATGFSVSATAHTVTVGLGGAGGLTNVAGTNGQNSVFSTISSTGGGAGGGNATNGNSGGSGGGLGQSASSYTQGAGNAGGYSPVEGYAGGDHGGASVNASSGGGGSSALGVNSGIGANNHAGAGGAGTASSITGSAVTRAGGGGGGTYNGTAGAGGTGGGGTGGTYNNSPAPTAGTVNTGSGGGGGSGNNGAAGGSGVVIIRRLTSFTGNSTANLTLQSTATTAESAPTTADLVMLIEDSGSGTATINTDIKAKISRDGSAFSGYVTLVDEGDWGTDKRILVARNIDISGIASGTAMKYKIETFNQSAGSKETRIHATSLAWA